MNAQLGLAVIDALDVSLFNAGPPGELVQQTLGARIVDAMDLRQHQRKVQPQLLGFVHSQLLVPESALPEHIDSWQLLENLKFPAPFPTPISPFEAMKRQQELFIKAAAEELTQSWGTRIEIKAKGKAGALVMHYGSEAELDRLFEALKHGPAKGR